MLFVLPNANFFSLGLGSMLALRDIFPRLLRVSIRFAGYVTVCFLILNSVLIAGTHFEGSDQIHYITMIIAFFWLVNKASIGFDGLVGKILTFPVFLYIGRISYGLYILHLFAAYPSAFFCKRILGVHEPTQLQWVLLNTIFTLAGAAISWHLFENPINSLKNHFFYQRKRVE